MKEKQKKIQKSFQNKDDKMIFLQHHKNEHISGQYLETCIFQIRLGRIKR